MDATVTAKVRGQSGWPASDAIEAAGFLARLKESAAILQQPDVGGYLSGAYAAKGKTVRELVQYMASNGLRFAPALPGDEPAYRAVQRRWRAATPAPTRRRNDARVSWKAEGRRGGSVSSLSGFVVRDGKSQTSALSNVICADRSGRLS